jgi:hypothetical protein
MAENDYSAANDNPAPREHRHLPEHREIYELMDRIQQEREAQTNMTPEQKARVDQALGNVELSDQIGGAQEAGDKPVPNDPTPMDKAREIGKDLHREGVTMDR